MRKVKSSGKGVVYGSLTVYFQARYYDPELGRFITQDPFEGDRSTPLSLHHYLYAYANPTVYVDLEGYESVFSEASDMLSQFGSYLDGQVAQYENGTPLGVAGAASTAVSQVTVGFGNVIRKPLDYVANRAQQALAPLTGADTSAATRDIDSAHAGLADAARGAYDFVANGGWKKTADAVKADTSAALGGDVMAVNRLTKDALNTGMIASNAASLAKAGIKGASAFKERISRSPASAAPQPASPVSSGVKGVVTQESSSLGTTVAGIEGKSVAAEAGAAADKVASEIAALRRIAANNSRPTAGDTISGTGRGARGNQLVDRVVGEIQGAVSQAERVLASGGTGGTPWGNLYQRLNGTGSPLEPMSRGNAIQQIADTQLSGNVYLREAGVISNRAHVFGLRNSAGNLLRPDFQIPLPGGKVGILDITTPGQAPKILKYSPPEMVGKIPQLINITY